MPYSFQLRRVKFYLLLILACAVGIVPVQGTHADLIDLVFEFDGNSPSGTTSFGTLELTQNGSLVQFVIVANTANLAGGDIHEFYFNLPNTVDLNSLVISNIGGVSNHPINSYSLLGSTPNTVGGAGASFDTGINFGNGGGPPGNGLLTTATFSLTASGGLLVSDFLSEFSTPNNAPPVLTAVHFQSANVFGAGSETVGGVVLAIPEPNAWILIASWMLVFSQRRVR